MLTVDQSIKPQKLMQLKTQQLERKVTGSLNSNARKQTFQIDTPLKYKIICNCNLSQNISYYMWNY